MYHSASMYKTFHEKPKKKRDTYYLTDETKFVIKYVMQPLINPLMASSTKNKYTYAMKPSMASSTKKIKYVMKPPMASQMWLLGSTTS